MSRNEFIDAYVVQFLAAWTAQHYEDYCSRGLHNELESPPIEDAIFLAEKAWERLVQFPGFGIPRQRD